MKLKKYRVPVYSRVGDLYAWRYDTKDKELVTHLELVLRRYWCSNTDCEVSDVGHAADMSDYENVTLLARTSSSSD